MKDYSLSGGTVFYMQPLGGSVCIKLYMKQPQIKEKEDFYLLLRMNFVFNMS